MPIRNLPTPQRFGYPHVRGTSLIELIVALAIIAIVSMTAAPVYRTVMRSNALSSNANSIVTAIGMARSEAVRRGVAVAVVANVPGNNWQAGWQVVADTDRDSVFNPAVDTVLATNPPLEASFGVRTQTTGGGTDGRVAFAINGAIQGATGFEFRVCKQGGPVSDDRRVIVRATGTVASYRDATASPVPTC